MKRLLFEQYKNFKILFRNLSSLFLLIIGPLTLILLIGFAYSGEGIHGINIGVITKNYESIEPALQNFSEFADILKYEYSEECMKDIALEKTHICLEFSDDFISSGDIPSGTVVFYFDNSKKALSNKIVDVISDFFGVQAEKISIESAKTIFSNIENMVVYLHDKNQDIFVLVNESKSIKLDLITRKNKLIEIRNDFLPIYNKIKLMQIRIDNISKEIDNSYSDYNSSYTVLDSDINDLLIKLHTVSLLNPSKEIYVYNDTILKITNNLTLINNQNFTYFNLSLLNYSITKKNLLLHDFNQTLDISKLDTIDISNLAIDSVLTGLVLFQTNFQILNNDTLTFYNSINTQKKEFEEAVFLLDVVKEMIDADIQSSDVYITKIEIATINMETAQKELNKSLKDLGKLNPDLAEKLIKPIMQNYEPMLPGIENIKLAFPGMLTIIIIFISILFANIITLTELNNKAFHRNSIAPVKKFLFISGLLITNIVVVMFQVTILLFVAYFSFKINIFQNFSILLLIIFILVILFSVLGMLLALVLRNEQTSILTTTFAALGFFLFSDAVTPLETMPKLAALIASKNPFVLASAAFRRILIYGVPMIKNELFYLGIYLVICFILLVYLTKKKL